jgi:hypothetical protein
MLDFFKPLFEFLKLTPRYLIAIGLVAGMLLFASDSFRDTLGLTKFAQDYRPFLGILLLSSITLILVGIAGSGIDWVKRGWQKRKTFQAITKRLQILSEDEKQVLRHYILRNTRSNSLRIDDGVVNGLAAIGIIRRVSQVGDMVNGFAYNISEVAWDYLHVHPHLLEGTTTVARTDRLW